MMEIKKKLKMDILEKQNTPRVYAVQNDANTRSVELNLFSGGFPWVVPDGVAISVAYRKPDKTSGWYDKLPDGSDAYSVDGNAVTITFAPQVLTVAGIVKASVILQNSETLDQLSVFPFEVMVEENPATGKSISNDYYNYSTMQEVNSALRKFERFIITVDMDSDGNFVADWHLEDINYAYESGHEMVAIYNGIVCPLVFVGEEKEYTFQGMLFNEYVSVTISQDDSVNVQRDFLVKPSQVPVAEADYYDSFSGAISDINAGVRTGKCASGAASERVWKVLNEVTVNEVVDSVTIDADSDGKAFSAKHMLVHMYLPKYELDGATGVGYSTYAINGKAIGKLGYCYPAGNWENGYFLFDIMACGDLVYVRCYKHESGSDLLAGRTLNEIFHFAINENVGLYESIISFKWSLFSSKVLPGSTFKVYGEVS